MMHLLETILPIFAVIGLGFVAGRRGFLPESFVGPANRLVYYLAIPAMVFRAVSGADFQRHFQASVLMTALAALALGCLASGPAAAGFAPSAARRASFRQSAFHGNMGYIGLAVVFFYLGDDALARAGILAGFLMILQNLLAVMVLSAGGGVGAFGQFVRVLGNPVILSSMVGIVFSAAGWRLPPIADRSLAILAQMALPMALLLIGASLSPHRILQTLAPALGASTIKLVLIPGLAVLFWRLTAVDAEQYLPALILLATPTATVAYVMGRQMGGDAELAAATISLSTLLSAATYIGWLWLAG